MALAPIQNFQASWNSNNDSLNPKSTIWKATLSKIKNILFYIPNYIMAACLNPLSATRFKAYDCEVSGVRTFTRRITTPDNVNLRIRVDTISGSNRKTPTVILFNPLGTKDGIYRDFRKTLLDKHCNVVSFDYRGRKTTSSIKDLVLDGDSVYQFVTNEMKTSASKVHFFGHSLGGAIAAQVKALHPESTGKYVGDRTFTSFFSVISEKCCISRLGSIIKMISSLIPRLLVAYPLYLLGWDFNTKDALEKMKGAKLTIIHPNDFLIPPEASASKYNKQSISLNPSIKGPRTHFNPINHQETAKKQNASLLVADFLAQD